MPRLLSVAAIPALLAAPAFMGAQIVTPRTVPVHQADQFDILPSSRGGMANVWIALDDSLLDPFVNPAKVTRHRQGSMFALPSFHSISENRGGGRTVPFGGYFASGDWGGAVAVAIQQIDRVNVAFGAPISERSATNQYLSGVLGRRLSNGVSIGLGVQLAAIGAIDGVDLLYAGSDTIRQNGSMADLRLGLTKTWEGNRVLDVVLLHSRTSMDHDVHTTTFGWDSVRRSWGPRTATWDHNADKTRIWGAHAEYVRPVGSEGWRLGYLATANRLSHPKIPNYRLMNIPRDPGYTNGFNLGVGVGRVVGPTTVGMELIYEPIFSETWADAARDTAVVGGGTIRAGGKTVENTFRFANSRIRLGVSRDIRHKTRSTSTLQFGLALGTVDYRLEQQNNVLKTNRVQNEQWMEWAPTFGYRFAARDLEFIYNARMTCLSGSECLSMSADDVSIAAPTPIPTGSGGGVVIVAPSSPLTFEGGRAMIHRFMVRIPIR